MPRPQDRCWRRSQRHPPSLVAASTRGWRIHTAEAEYSKCATEWCPDQAGVSELQIAGEAFALFAVPSGAFGLGGRLSLGFYGSSALAAATAGVSLRGVQDAARASYSGTSVYVFDALTGAVLGVVVPGGVKLVGGAGTATLDWLATRGMVRSDVLITKAIAEKISVSATRSISRNEVEALLRPRGMSGKVADWWLSRRGTIILYRGQERATANILSPIARESGLEASQKMVEEMRAAGLTNDEIALYTAKVSCRAGPVF